jgi:hypothetical protein
MELEVGRINMRIYGVKLVISPVRKTISKITRLKIFVRNEERQAGESRQRMKEAGKRGRIPFFARRRGGTALDIEEYERGLETPDTSEVKERTREMEAAETAMESKNEAIERTIVKRFLQKQPPRKSTGQRGH